MKKVQVHPRDEGGVMLEIHGGDDVLTMVKLTAQEATDLQCTLETIMYDKWVTQHGLDT